MQKESNKPASTSNANSAGMVTAASEEYVFTVGDAATKDIPQLMLYRLVRLKTLCRASGVMYARVAVAIRIRD
jgi:hypothetical protein